MKKSKTNRQKILNKKKLCAGFIAFEGLDGSGKSTQSKLLMSWLKKQGYKTAKIDFPQYGKKSAGLIEEYLNGKYGTSKEVGPYRASIFYACDRYDASFKIRKWLREGRIVVADRYVASNMGHQGGKLKNKKARKAFIKWLYNLEYEILKIPKPNFSFILKTSPAFARKLAPKITAQEKKQKRKVYLGSKLRDIHEKDLSHLADALASYLEAAREFPRDFKVIECMRGGTLLSSGIVHQKVVKIMQNLVGERSKDICPKT